MRSVRPGRQTDDDRPNEKGASTMELDDHHVRLVIR